MLDWAIEVNLVQTEIMTNKTKIRYRFLFNINKHRLYFMNPPTTKRIPIIKAIQAGEMIRDSVIDYVP